MSPELPLPHSRFFPSYNQLAQCGDTPLSQPAWAVDPTESLFLMTEEVPRALYPYIHAIGNNLLALLKACGFDHTDGPVYITGNICFDVYFPTQAVSSRRAPPKSTLYAEDQFTALERSAADGARTAGAFVASDFGRLIDNARRERSEDRYPQGLIEVQFFEQALISLHLNILVQ
jgi:hypothetical protein